MASDLCILDGQVMIASIKTSTFARNKTILDSVKYLFRFRS